MDINSGEGEEIPFLSGSDAFSCALYLHQSVGMLQDKMAQMPRNTRHCCHRLSVCNELYTCCVGAREAGGDRFESTETQMIFNDQGKIEKIVPVVRNDAQTDRRCMLAANVCASDFLAQHKHPTLYRVHEGPTPKTGKLARLVA